MRAHYLTAKEARVAQAAAERAADKMCQDIALRSQYLWMATMLLEGLSAKTVNRCLKRLPQVTEKYEEYRKEGVADYALYSKLKAAGVNVDITKEEL